MKKYPIEHITVPKNVAEVAAERTKGIVRHWVWTGKAATLENLAISLYLQGIQDAVNASSL